MGGFQVREKDGDFAALGSSGNLLHRKRPQLAQKIGHAFRAPRLPTIGRPLQLGHGARHQQAARVQGQQQLVVGAVQVPRSSPRSVGSTDRSDACRSAWGRSPS